MNKSNVKDHACILARVTMELGIGDISHADWMGTVLYSMNLGKLEMTQKS